MIAFVFVFIHPFGDGNGRIHRYFDATPQTEYLYGCVIDTVRQDLRNEVLFLEIFDRAMRGGWTASARTSVPTLLPN